MTTRALALLACFFVSAVGCGDDSLKNETPPDICVPTACEDAHAVCGTIDDGCGGRVSCGSCEGSDVCVDGQCVASCIPVGCENAVCGTIDDGCGGTVSCGSCEGGDECIDGQCVGTCDPIDCEEASAVCGTIDDGCGGTLSCGSCGGSDVCVDGECVGTCDPIDCEEASAVCGTIDDGCGGTVSCGGCGGSDVCVDGECVGTCTPIGCEDASAVCGSIDDGCGGTVSCGSCEGSDVCADGQCVASCIPVGCENAVCGTIDDGCGGTVSCGDCGIAWPESWAWGWPRPTGTSLSAIWSFSDDDTWAAGYDGNLVHWNGAGLDLIPSGTTAHLLGLWASAPNDLWAVGEKGTLLHFDGSRWSFRASPTGADLIAVGGTGPDDVWVLPRGGASLVHCRLASCSLVPAPLASGVTALSASEAHGVWALGPGGELASWNGNAWVLQPVSGSFPGLSDLAVGGTVRARSGTRVLRWSSGTWLEEARGPWATFNQPIHLHASDTDVLWALVPEGASGHGLFALEGGAWSRITAGIATGQAIHTNGTSLWIAGARGQLAHLPTRTTPVVLSDEPLYCQDLASVPRGQEVQWVRCGVDVLRVEGDVVEILPRPELLRNESGRGIFSRGRDEVWLISNRTRVHRWQNGGWQTFTEFGGKTLNAMAGVGDDLWVFGEKGLAWRWLGSGFSEAIQTPTQLNLLSAWAAGAEAVWAVGGSLSDGVIVRWNGSGWQTWSQPKLNWVHGTSGNDVWAVGDGGLALHWDGQTWSRRQTGTTALLRKVWAHAPDEVFVVPGTDDPALEGRFLHYDGSRWKPGPAPLHTSQAVALTPAGRMISAGDGVLLGL